ncbi:MAG: hypothetical protein ACK4F9_02860 [Brevinematia bacterium]
MKKFLVVLVIITLVVLIGILVSYILYVLEVSSLQDVVLKFVRASQVRDIEILRRIAGGKIFAGIFSGESGVNEYFLEELSRQFPRSSQLKFLKVYRSSELSQDEKRKYGFLSWKVNLLVVNENDQYVLGYSFYVSRFSEIESSGKEVIYYRIIDFVKIGEIIF